MNRRITLLVLAMTGLIAYAQQSENDPKSSFEEFRKGLLNNYQSFRKGILDDYAKFLDGVWVEYNSFKGTERNTEPKPSTAPVAIPEAAPVKVPAPTITAPEPQPVAAPETVTVPEVQTQPVATTPGTPTISFPFYGIDMELQAPEFRIAHDLRTPSDFAEQWRSLDSTPDARKLAQNLKNLADKHKFNDYLTYELVSQYVGSRYPNVSASSRTSLVHYIMANLGYDVRLGATGKGNGLLLIPCKQLVYGKMYLVFNGEKYYVFTDPAVTLDPDDTRISTCKLPDAAAESARFDLRLSAPSIPYAAKPFDIKYGSLHLTGEVNANLMPIIYHYPQMPIADYASSELMPELRADIVKQVREQLAGKDKTQAVNSLLQFVQNGFKYATDEDLHGFEKPYFFEETLFYDKCDCEDRVIFYTYLLWNALGVENHLLGYPGHESAAVTLPDSTNGDSYNYDGKVFLISDPTYIGSKTGMCMPNYRSTAPEIDHIYK